MISFAANVLFDDCLKFTGGSETFSLDFELKYNTLHPLFCLERNLNKLSFALVEYVFHSNHHEVCSG